MASCKPYATSSITVLLAEHQIDAVERALQILGAFGGVILADDVGLGKSFVAAEVARRLRCEVDLIVPASLVEQWREFDLDAAILTHDGIVTAPFFAEPSRRRLVIVDEAHAFRNPATQRYDALARRTLAARVMLVTATPVCNSAGDLHALLALIVADDALRGYGIPSIDVAFERRDFSTIDQIVAALVIRRDRSVLPPRLQFGALERNVIRYDVPDAPIDALQFPLTGNALLLRQFLWRRLESSEAALAESIQRQRRFYERVLERGRALTKRDYRRVFGHEEDAFQQLLFWDLFVPPDEPIDVDAIHAEMRRLDAIRPTSNKLELLRSILTDEPTLIFTSFIATARQIAKALGVPRGAMEAFRRGMTDVLVTTDFAAEGLNLQRAAVVIHYDIPWNPVKLDQRNGRAHRIGQTRETVRAIYFLPRQDRANVGRIVVAKNRIRRRVLSVAPAILPANPTAIRPRVLKPIPINGVEQRRHRAGLQRLIDEMSRELLDDARVAYLLAIVRAEDNLRPWTC